MRKSKIAWNSIEDVGLPPLEYRFNPDGLERDFLLRGEYSIFVGSVFKDGSGFNINDEITDTPNAWAIIEGF